MQGWRATSLGTFSSPSLASCPPCSERRPWCRGHHRPVECTCRAARSGDRAGACRRMLRGAEASGADGRVQRSNHGAPPSRPQLPRGVVNVIAKLGMRARNSCCFAGGRRPELHGIDSAGKGSRRTAADSIKAVARARRQVVLPRVPRRERRGSLLAWRPPLPLSPASNATAARRVLVHHSRLAGHEGRSRRERSSSQSGVRASNRRHRSARSSIDALAIRSPTHQRGLRRSRRGAARAKYSGERAGERRLPHAVAGQAPGPERVLLPGGNFGPLSSWKAFRRSRGCRKSKQHHFGPVCERLDQQRRARMRIARALRNGTVWINEHNKLFAGGGDGRLPSKRARPAAWV